MTSFFKVVMIIFGFMSIAGGLHQASKLWPGAQTTEKLLKNTERYIELMNEGRQVEASTLFQQYELAKSLAPIQKKAALYWGISGFVSAAIFWTFALILHILANLQDTVSRFTTLRVEPKWGSASEGAEEKDDLNGEERYKEYEILENPDGTYGIYKERTRVPGSLSYSSLQTARDFLDHFG